MLADPGVHFRYDDETHTYTLGDTVLPHPTGVLAPYTKLDLIPPDKLFVAREFGKSVHEYIEAYNNDTLDMENLPPAVESAYDMTAIVRGYDAFYRDNMLVPHTVEKPLLHKELRYGCTPDFISGNTIYDLKPMSQKNKRIVGVQLAANAGAAISNELVDKANVKLCSLHYDAFGKWEPQFWPFEFNWKMWVACLSVHNYLGGEK
jgi:hypothetical protein